MKIKENILSIREVILGRNYTTVQNVAKPLIRLQTLINIGEFILGRNHTHMKNMTKLLIATQTLLVIK